MKYRFKVEHLPTGKVWYTAFQDEKPGDISKDDVFLKSVCSGASYFAAPLEDGRNKIYLNSEILKSCALYMETSEYD